MKISHTSIVSDNELRPILRSGVVKLKVNKDIINSEITRLQSEIGKYNNNYDDINLKTLISYLTKLKRTVDSETSEIELRWSTGTDGVLRTTPLQLVSEPAYGIDTNSLIELGPSQQLINIDISEMAEIISFEMINRDLGESHQSVEAMLQSCSIVSPNESKILIDKFNENNDKMYKSSQVMKIGESTFLNKTDNLMYNYFMSRKFDYVPNKTMYKDVVYNSCMLAAGLYASHIMNNLHKCKIESSLTGVTPQRITILINRETNPVFDFNEKAFEEIILSAFGRKFCIVPNVMVY